MARAFPVIHAQSAGKSPTELVVFGERNSGTNLAHALLQRNFPVFSDVAGGRTGQVSLCYGWTHGFPMMLAAPDHVLAVCTFRHPETWLRCMHARPCDLAPDLKTLPFEDFICEEWHTLVDEKNSGLDADDPCLQQELHWDRHPMTGKRFESILALRTAKTAAFLTLPERFSTCLLVRHEDIADDPEGFVSYVAETYDLERKPTFHAVDRRGQHQDEAMFSPQNYPPLSVQDKVHVWANLDAAQEQILGYEPSKT